MAADLAAVFTARKAKNQRKIILTFQIRWFFIMNMRERTNRRALITALIALCLIAVGWFFEWGINLVLPRFISADHFNQSRLLIKGGYSLLILIGAFFFHSYYQRFTGKDRGAQIEKILKDSPQRILHSLPGLYFLCNRNGEFIDFYTSSQEELIIEADKIVGANLFHILPESLAKDAMHYVSKSLATNTLQKFEYSIERDEKKFYEARIIPQISDIVLIIVENITDKRITEDNLKTSLQEKDILIKEIHHRVKNNLQLVNSILSLQSRYTQDREIKKIFTESQNRVKTMALIHERLYRAEDASLVNFHEYLTSLTKNLLTTYGYSDCEIKVSYMIDEVAIPLDKAIPCGLIFNELLSNSLQHAFDEFFNGEKRLKFSLTQKDKTIIIEAADNGIGMQKKENKGTLGWQLIEALTSQLKAKITVDSSQGTHVKLTFNLE